MSKHAWILVAGLAGPLALGLQGCGAIGGADEGGATRQTAIVERGELALTIDGTGSLATGKAVSLAFAGGGTVDEVFVAEGDGVVAGQPIAVLDTRDLRLALQSAEASLASAQVELASARASLERLRAGPDANALAVAQINLDKARDQRWGSQAQRDGVCGRVEAGRGAQYECDQAEASVLQAEDGVRLAELALEELQAGADADALADARDKVAQAQAQVAAAEIQRDRARLGIEQATLSTPISGTVTALAIEPGASAGTAQAALVEDLAALEVVVQVDETDVGRIAVGQPARVILDAYPDAPLEGQVASIAPVADTQSGVVLFPVTVAVDTGGLDPRPGMTAEVEIIVERVAHTLIIPLRAVQSGPEGDTVIRLPSAGGMADAAAPGRPAGGAAVRPAATVDLAAAERVPVTLGLVTDSQVEVRQGLAEGDVILLPGAPTGSDAEEGPPPMPFGGVLRGR